MPADAVMGMKLEVVKLPLRERGPAFFSARRRVQEPRRVERAAHDRGVERREVVEAQARADQGRFQEPGAAVAPQAGETVERRLRRRRLRGQGGRERRLLRQDRRALARIVHQGKLDEPPGAQPLQPENVAGGAERARLRHDRVAETGERRAGREPRVGGLELRRVGTDGQRPAARALDDERRAILGFSDLPAGAEADVDFGLADEIDEAHGAVPIPRFR